MNIMGVSVNARTYETLNRFESGVKIDKSIQLQVLINIAEQIQIN